MPHLPYHDINDILEGAKGSYGLRVRMAWGRRRANPTSPAPSLPARPEPRSAAPHDKGPLFTYEVYNTLEEAQEKAALRAQGKNISPPPHPAVAQQ
jgi:hypothetical protein